MTTLTIIKDDNNIAKDGVWRVIDCSVLASNVHAVQWNGSTGHVEYNDGTVNETISDISAYDSLVTAWTNAAPVELSEAQVADLLASKSYDIRREHNYATLAEQQDQQYWDAVNGTTVWKDAIAAVKAAHPKP